MLRFGAAYIRYLTVPCLLKHYQLCVVSLLPCLSWPAVIACMANIENCQVETWGNTWHNMRMHKWRICTGTMMIWGKHLYVGKISQAGISNHIPQFSVGCDYLSLPDIKVIIYPSTNVLYCKLDWSFFCFFSAFSDYFRKHSNLHFQSFLNFTILQIFNISRTLVGIKLSVTQM